MNHRFRVLWRFFDLRLGMLHLHWSLLLNFTLFFTMSCLLRFRLLYAIISRFEELSVYLTVVDVIDISVCFSKWWYVARLLQERDPEDTWLRQTNILPTTLKDFWRILWVLRQLTRKWNPCALILGMKSVLILRSIISIYSPGMYL